MQIIHFDEVKYLPGKQPCYWIAGLIAPPESIYRLEQKVGDLAEEIFGHRLSLRASEFHASDIFHRNANFKEWRDPAKRIAVLKRLIDILASEAQNLGKIASILEPGKMKYGVNDLPGTAFMYFVERVEMYLHDKRCPGMLIGDRDDDNSVKSFSESLSRYKENGTEWEFGRELTHLIDTVHFTNSHHSRMLQLADLFVWLLQLVYAGDQGKKGREEVIANSRSKNDLLRLNRYKRWPAA